MKITKTQQLKKRKKLREFVQLTQNMLFFSSSDEHNSLFTNYTIH